MRRVLLSVVACLLFMPAVSHADSFYKLLPEKERSIQESINKKYKNPADAQKAINKALDPIFNLDFAKVIKAMPKDLQKSFTELKAALLARADKGEFSRHQIAEFLTTSMDFAKDQNLAILGSGSLSCVSNYKKEAVENLMFFVNAAKGKKNIAEAFDAIVARVQEKFPATDAKESMRLATERVCQLSYSSCAVLSTAVSRLCDQKSRALLAVDSLLGGNGQIVDAAPEKAKETADGGAPSDAGTPVVDNADAGAPDASAHQ